MIWVIAIGAGLLPAVACILLYCFYMRALELVIADRDAARQEVETLRAALFPQLARITGAAPSTTPQTPAAPRSSVKPPNPKNLTLEQLFPPRVPWRIRARMMAAAHNTKQIGRDLHAAAIAHSKPKETPHA